MGNERQYMIRPAKQGEAGEIRRMVYTARINPMGLDWRRFVVAVDPDGRLEGYRSTAELCPHVWKFVSKNRG